MLYILAGILGIYALFTLMLFFVWIKNKPLPTTQAANQPTITVIIPVRNEEKTLPKLLADLEQQTYSKAYFEVIVADDSSTDNTLSITQNLISQVSYPLRLLPLPNERTASPKKRAITASIAQASGDLIVTTDGDCRVGPRWLETIATYYQQTGAKLISGPVTFTAEQTSFDFLQTVEGSSLIGAGACTMMLGVPTMCNGANLVYEKKVFSEVGGFSGVDHVASGDDELLMHKIARQYPNDIHFLKNSAAIVQTGPHRSFSAFYHQRKRWASKWRAYESYLPSVLAVFIFSANAAFLATPLLFFLGSLTGFQAFLLFLLKVAPEWLFLGQVLVFLQKRKAVGWILPTQFVYSLYVVFFGLAAQKKGFRWKDRELN